MGTAMQLLWWWFIEKEGSRRKKSNKLCEKYVKRIKKDSVWIDAHVNVLRLLEWKDDFEGREMCTCLKEARHSLPADLVARPARHCSVIHFRSRRIVQPWSVKLLVLFQTFSSSWTPRCLYMRVSRLWHLNQFTRVVECPVKGQWLRMALDLAHEGNRFLFQSSYHNFAFAFFADWCNYKKRRQKKTWTKKYSQFYVKLILEPKKHSVEFRADAQWRKYVADDNRRIIINLVKIHNIRAGLNFFMGSRSISPHGVNLAIVKSISSLAMSSWCWMSPSQVNLAIPEEILTLIILPWF